MVRIEKLRKSKVLKVDWANPYELNRDSAKRWMKDNLRKEYRNSDTGEKIVISKAGINEVTAHGSQDEMHLKSLSAIPEMIEQSIFIEEMPNSKGHDKYDSYRYYVCGLKIDDVDYTAKIVIGVKDGNKYYDHRLTEIEKGTLIDNLNGLSNSVAENQNASISMGKDTRLLSLLQTNSSKVVDKNGEPMVVFHDTNSTMLINRETGENWDELEWRAREEWNDRSDWDEYWEEQDLYVKAQRADRFGLLDDEDALYRTSGEIDAQYPNWLDGTTTDSGKHSTQVEGTRKTYNKVGTWIEEKAEREAKEMVLHLACFFITGWFITEKGHRLVSFFVIP